ncbi:MAG: hypothetical protein ACI9OJ_002561 [Myxococcota bacterium]|jgi:hypothetical protein
MNGRLTLRCCAFFRGWVAPAMVLALWSGCAEETVESSSDCVSDLDYFQREVSLPLLEKRCVACHTADGLAKHSKLVLASNSESNYLKRNFDAMREIASYQYEGDSLLLLKPTNRIAHGGGEQFAVGSADYNAIAGLLERFSAPNSCTPISGDAKLIERVDLYDLPETLRHARMQLLGSVPTPEQMELVAGGDEAVLRTEVAGWLEDDRFHDTLKLWLNDFLHTDKYLGGQKAIDLLDSEDYPNRKYYDDIEDSSERKRQLELANDSVARAPLELVSHVVRNNLPFTEVLTADYMILNPFSAQVYGVSNLEFSDEANPAELKPGRIPGISHAGILTSPMFLNRFPTTDTNLNRHRSRMVMQFFLATDILKSGERPLDPTQVSDHNPTMNNAQCTVCHAELDPLAGAFQNWDSRGRYRPPESGWKLDLRPPGFGDEIIPTNDWPRSLQWVGSRVAGDERFALAAVHMVYEGLIGRAPVTNPTDTSDPRYDAQLAFHNIEREFLDRTAGIFIENNYNLKSIIPEVILSPFYRAKALGADLPEAEVAALADLGTSQLLTPERLHDRVVAVTGFPWRYRVDHDDRLLNNDEYLFFYGGIDSDQVTRRISEPNGIMANVGYRLAAEMGCIMAPREFGMDALDRRLFALIEPSYEPEDINGFEVPEASEAIRATIVHLHAHVLGEVLSPAHPEVEATFQLFYATWKEGKAAVADETLSRDIEWHCQHRRDFWTDAELPDEAIVSRDANYTIRAWSAVLTYLMADFRFLYE